MNYCVHNEIMRMQNYMRKHYWHPIGVEDVAKSVGYSPRRANLLYQDCTGETIGDYLRFLRMEDAKVHLQHKIPIERVALSLSYTPRGFLKTFRNYFGVSPSQYAKNGHLNDRYVKHYEYVSDGLWGRGENPTPDGLWEFSCYDPAVKKYFPMKWSDSQELFLAPLNECRSSPQWYCRNRDGGNGMHPGRATHAVKSFRCPHGGDVEIFFSVGRRDPYRKKWSRNWKSWATPCSAQLYLNGQPLCEDVVMENADPVFFKITCSILAGDKISLHIDPLGDHVADGVVLYRQRISYLRIVE